jgi:alkylated DNA repair protein (DNA oxidative demethylase)
MMRGEYQLPKGFITDIEERELLDWTNKLEYGHVIIQDNPAKRTIRQFGYKYSFESDSLSEGEPIPHEVLWLRDRCAEKAGLAPIEIASCLVTKYPPESTIGWHVDARPFGSKVIGISLNSSCQMQFQRRKADKRFVYELSLEPRSFYLISGEARYLWQHRITPTSDLRYSITFRTIR